MFDPAPPKYLKALGKITNAISQLEWFMVHCIQRCSSIKTYDEIICLVGGDNFDVLYKKLDKMVKFILQDEPKLLQEFKKIVGSLEDVNRDRNKYVHSIWFLKPPNLAGRTKVLRTIKSGTRLWESELVSIDKLNKLIKDIAKTQNNLLSFMFSYLLEIDKAIDKRVREYDATKMLATSKKTSNSAN